MVPGMRTARQTDKIEQIKWLQREEVCPITDAALLAALVSTSGERA